MNNDVKRFNARKYYLPKGIFDNYNITVNGKNFYDQEIDLDIKGFEEIRKLTTWQGEDYTTGCFLDYDYIKNHDRLRAVDLNRQNELDADPKAIQLIESFGELKSDKNQIVAIESKFVLTVLEKIKETRSKFSQGSLTVL